MASTPTGSCTPPPPLTRRHLLQAGALGTLAGVATTTLPGRAVAATDDAAALLRKGGVVVAFRHALAPGTFDPPNFKLGDCSTQRNLSAEGREQARRTGAWFATQGLRPDSVRSSPWCRCMDTATLAFGAAQPWEALASPVGSPETTTADRLAQLRTALVQAKQQPGRFAVGDAHVCAGRFGGCQHRLWRGAGAAGRRGGQAGGAGAGGGGVGLTG